MMIVVVVVVLVTAAVTAATRQVVVMSHVAMHMRQEAIIARNQPLEKQEMEHEGEKQQMNRDTQSAESLGYKIKGHNMVIPLLSVASPLW